MLNSVAAVCLAFLLFFFIVVVRIFIVFSCLILDQSYSLYDLLKVT